MAEAKKEFKLDQTKSYFKVEGKVVGMDREGTYREGEVEQGKNEGKTWRSIRFGVQTSEENTIYVELFGMEQDFIYPWSQKAKKSQKIAFEKRNNPPSGYHVIGVNIGLENDEKGKQVRKSLVELDAVEYIHSVLTNGESIQVTGKVEYGEYENKKGDKVPQTRFIIGSIFTTKEEINFDAEDYKEVCVFDQEFVYVDSEYEEEDGKRYVTARVIGYADKWQDVTLVIDADKSEGLKKLSDNFGKLKFGKLIKVIGKPVNRVDMVEVEVEDDEGDEWGGEEVEGYNRSSVKSYTNELQILKVDKAWTSDNKDKTYTEDDFIADDLIEDGELDEEQDPFGDDDDDDDDGDDDNTFPFDE